ncbi:RNA polymerase sigma factor [Natranaerofaba carboxydovora]|uniref:RNA polymerase sigma factor n=1 Tax=Natranaerofaba carboxydovora TaxID=2742683 RepID=UPI001F1474B1|nr:sigma-70 family RNA polymerase sigma factor [Natranaerofaba carboxydovora]UMZ74440.1 ECF RNA polymerase sigma factor SigW [Natranaerofaba carboxydovora]
MDDIAFIVEKCKDGDMDAFERLFMQFSDKAYRTAFLIIRNEKIAEDAVQEAFIKCFNRIHQLKDPDAFQTWLYRTLVRTCWDLVKKEKKYVPLDEGNIQVSKKVSDVDVFLTRDIIRKSMGKLKPSHRTALVLYYFNGLTTKEMSQVLGCSTAGAKTRLHRARKKLAYLLKNEGVNPYSEELGENYFEEGNINVR